MISIHALREEGDPPRLRQQPLHLLISIHALREEGDPTAPSSITVPSHFYPRPPRGGRRRVVAVVADPDLFLSTPSARRATRTVTPPLRGATFLSTPSARRATMSSFGLPLIALFLSTPSARRATGYLCSEQLFREISIHALREEGDSASVVAALDTLEFLSTPSARRATSRPCRSA